VAELRARGYSPQAQLERQPVLRAVIDAIGGGTFSPEEPGRYRDLADALRWHDHYLLLADFEDYVRAQERVDALFRDREAWASKAIANVAGMGFFSTDRTIGDYAREIWAIEGRA
jgi:starch phosphorylase